MSAAFHIRGWVFCRRPCKYKYMYVYAVVEIPRGKGNSTDGYSIFPPFCPSLITSGWRIRTSDPMSTHFWKHDRILVWPCFSGTSTAGLLRGEKSRRREKTGHFLDELIARFTFAGQGSEENPRAGEWRHPPGTRQARQSLQFLAQSLPPGYPFSLFARLRCNRCNMKWT